MVVQVKRQKPVVAQEQTPPEPFEPHITVYLNERMVFDLTAMLEGGIATVRQLERRQRSERSRSADWSAQADFGMPSLFSVNLGGAGGARRAAGTENAVSEERVHTPTSLFFALRNALQSRNLLLPSSDWPEVALNGRMVEFPCSIRRNSLIHILQSIRGIMKLATAFTPQTPKSGSPQRKARQAPEEQMLDQIDTLVDELSAGTTVDVIGDLPEQATKALMTIEPAFLTDPTMGDLADGRFHVMGKVIASELAGGNPLSLLRHTSLSVLRSGFLEQMLSGIGNLAQDDSIQLPELEVEINPPFVHVLPVAIFA